MNNVEIAMPIPKKLRDAYVSKTEIAQDIIIYNKDYLKRLKEKCELKTDKGEQIYHPRIDFDKVMTFEQFEQSYPSYKLLNKDNDTIRITIKQTIKN